MKTAIELAAALSARYLDTKQMLPDELAHEAAAMLLQQAEWTKALKALVDNPRSSAFGKEAEKLADDWLAANGPGGWIDDLRNKCEALEITNDALKADAERYRWLSRNPTYLGWDADFEAEFVDFEVDKAIDAMKGKS